MATTYTAVDTSDFNGDGTFSECEIDIGWAYLQVLAGIEAGLVVQPTSDAAMLVAVQAQYDLNLGSSVADASLNCGPITQLPSEIFMDLLGLDSVLGYWRLNEQGPDYPAKVFPIYDSSSNLTNGSASKVAADNKNVVTKHGLGLFNWSTLTIPDSSGTLFSNSGDWTFHAKIFVENNLSFMLKKGSFKIPFNNNTLYVTCASGVKVLNFPNGVTQSTFSGTFIDLFLRKEEDYFKLDIVDENGATHSFGQFKAGQGLIQNDSVNSDIVISGKGTKGSGYKKGAGLAWFSEMYVKNHSAETLSSSFNLPPIFRFLHNGDSDNTYEASSWTNPTGEQLAIAGNVPLKSGLQSSGSSTFANISGANNYISYNNFDLTQDFTLSFWYRRWGNAPEILSILDGANGLKLSLTNKLYFSFNSTNGTLNKSKTSGEGGNVWHHLTVVKSNGRIAFFVDAEPKLEGFVLQYRSGNNVNSSLDAGLTNCVLKLGGHSNSPTMNISDITLIQGGVVRVNNAWALGVANDASMIEAIKDRSYFA